jgi:hypothetical protein
LPSRNKFEHCFGQAEQAQRVGHRGPALADAFGDGLVRQAEVLLQGGVGLGFFDRVQVAALQVLDQRQLEQAAVVDRVENRDRHLGEARKARGAPPALAGDDRVSPSPIRGYDDRLDDSLLFDRVREGLQIGLFEASTRLRGGWASEGRSPGPAPARRRRSARRGPGRGRASCPS